MQRFLDSLKNNRLAAVLLLILPLPLFFSYLQTTSLLDPLKNLAMDWRFLARGPIEAPIRTVYVNFDEVTNNTFGQEFFPREVHAQAGKAILGAGEARALFYDIVFSAITASRAVNVGFLYEQDLAMGNMVKSYPGKVILAAWYSNQFFSFMDRPSTLPLKWKNSIHEGAYDSLTNAYPEVPVYPIWNPFTAGGDKAYGRIGLINVDMETSAGPAPRWMPLYTEVTSPVHVRNYLANLVRFSDLSAKGQVQYFFEEKGEDQYAFGVNMGGMKMETDVFPKVIPVSFFTAAVELLLAYHGWDTQEAVSLSEEELILSDPEAEGEAYRIPLTEGQLAEINWFSPWDSLEAGDHDDASVQDIVRQLNQLHRNFAETEPEKRLERLDRILERLRALKEDPYNPKMSLAVVYFLSLLHGQEDYSVNDPAVSERAGSFLKDFFKDSVVLVGPTDPTMQDVAPAPMDPGNVPRVSAHGNLFKTILTGKFLRRLPLWLDLTLVTVPSEETAQEFARLVSGGQSFAAAGKALGVGDAVVEAEWLRAKDMDPAILKAAIVLPEGQITGPVRSARGWHVVRNDLIWHVSPFVYQQDNVADLARFEVVERAIETQSNVPARFVALLENETRRYLAERALARGESQGPFFWRSYDKYIEEFGDTVEFKIAEATFDSYDKAADGLDYITAPIARATEGFEPEYDFDAMSWEEKWVSPAKIAPGLSRAIVGAPFHVERGPIEIGGTYYLFVVLDKRGGPSYYYDERGRYFEQPGMQSWDPSDVLADLRANAEIAFLDPLAVAAHSAERLPFRALLDAFQLPEQ